MNVNKHKTSIPGLRRSILSSVVKPMTSVKNWYDLRQLSSYFGLSQWIQSLKAVLDWLKPLKVHRTDYGITFSG